MSTGQGVDQEWVGEWLVDSAATRVLRRPRWPGRPDRSTALPRKQECGGRWLDFAAPPDVAGHLILSEVATEGTGARVNAAFENALLDAVRHALGPLDAANEAAAFNAIQSRQGATFLPPFKQKGQLSITVSKANERERNFKIIFSVDDLLFDSVGVHLSTRVGNEFVELELRGRPDPPLSTTAIGAFEDVPIAFDLHVGHLPSQGSGRFFTTRVIHGVRALLDRGHAMLGSVARTPDSFFFPPDGRELSVSISLYVVEQPPREALILW
jgi:hypothetical protein